VFYGKHSHKIDAKNRLILPSDYRKELGERFFVMCGYNRSQCLYIYNEESFSALKAKLEALPDANGGIDLKRFIFSNTVKIEIEDGAPYRFVIPPELKKFASLDKDAVILGISNKLEIWDSKAYEVENTPNIKSIAELSDSFNI